MVMHLNKFRSKVKPRIAVNEVEQDLEEPDWEMNNSFFSKYKIDNDSLMAQCFDFDWKCSSIERLVKNDEEREEIMKYLRPRYGTFREAYKHLACLAPSAEIPSLGANLLSELLLRCGDFVDYKYIKLSDVDLAFIATNASGSKKFPFRTDEVINPERQLIRYQFLEVLLRLALERFVKKQRIKPVEAIKLLYEKYICGILTHYQSHTWRIDRFWNRECENVILQNMEILKDIFNQWAEAQFPGDPKVLRLARLIELVTLTDVCDDSFGAREIGPLHNLSMMTHVDEIHSTKHMDMKFYEFVECIARVADKSIDTEINEFEYESNRPGATFRQKNSKSKN